MPKVYTSPTLFDECKTISIKRLKEWGYLSGIGKQSGTITWSRFGEVYASIGITVDTSKENHSYIELKYNIDSVPVYNLIPLVKRKSNLGRGECWYFLCPKTVKLCRKLHSVGGHFYHRTAFKGCMYESQTYSKAFRVQVPYLRAVFWIEKSASIRYGKHYKTTYRNKPTKSFQKYQRMEQLADIAFQMQLY